MCKVQEIEGKGRGLVLTRAVESGSLLVKEQALVVLRKDKVAWLFTVVPIVNYVKFHSNCLIVQMSNRHIEHATLFLITVLHTRV